MAVDFGGHDCREFLAARLDPRHRAGDDHGELPVRHLQRHRHAAEVGRVLGRALEEAALDRALDLLLDRGDAHQRRRRVALEARAAQHAGTVARREQREQRAAGRRHVQRHQLARARGVADRMRRLDRVDEEREPAARRREHRRLAGALDERAQQGAQLVGNRRGALDLLQQRRPERRRVVAAARVRLVEVAARDERAEQVEGARARPVEVARDLGERGGPPVPGEELDQIENVGGLLDVHGSAMEQVIGGSKAAVILPDARRSKRSRRRSRRASPRAARRPWRAGSPRDSRR